MSGTVRSLKKVGEHFGRCERTARRWARAGMPRTGSRAYDLGEIESWLRKKLHVGGSFKQMEKEELAIALFEIAVLELRQGLIHLCQSYVVARGRSRARLVDRAVRDILQGTMTQATLLVDPEETTP